MAKYYPAGIPAAVVKALNHVRSVFPNVNHVAYCADGRWLYMDENGNMPAFNGLIDVGILEDAADALDSFPAIFCCLD